MWMTGGELPLNLVPLDQGGLLVAWQVYMYLLVKNSVVVAWCTVHYE